MIRRVTRRSRRRPHRARQSPRVLARVPPLRAGWGRWVRRAGPGGAGRIRTFTRPRRVGHFGSDGVAERARTPFT